jgi:hypothetical protein
MTRLSLDHPSAIAELHDNSRPRYLPHLAHPEVLQMGLSPLQAKLWIETDGDLGRYHRHKHRQRERHGERVYRGDPGSTVAQRELAGRLLRHLSEEQGQLYRLEEGKLSCEHGGFSVAVDAAEPLWCCSLWVADDLVIMEKRGSEYHLTAASLCFPSHWQLEEKFGRPMREIHDPIPGFHRKLSPRIDRFFDHLRPEHPVVRYNWSLQAGGRLSQRLEETEDCPPGAALFYRTERQSLVRLPQSGAIAFTIRVYVHPLEALAEVPGALSAMFAAIDATPRALARYKGFDRLEPALSRYREL